MNTTFAPIDSSGSSKETVRSTVLQNLVRRIVLSRLEKLQSGQIALSEDGKHYMFGQLTDEFPLTVQLDVLNPKFYSDVAFGGSIGAGEAYIHGHWACTELTELLRILVRNRDVLSRSIPDWRCSANRFRNCSMC